MVGVEAIKTVVRALARSSDVFYSNLSLSTILESLAPYRPQSTPWLAPLYFCSAPHACMSTEEKTRLLGKTGVLYENISRQRQKRNVGRCEISRSPLFVVVSMPSMSICQPSVEEGTHDLVCYM